MGRISRCGDEMMRTALYEAASALLTRTRRWSWLKAWAMQVLKRRGKKRAKVALARRLGVVLHGMWVDGSEFRCTRDVAGVAVEALRPERGEGQVQQPKSFRSGGGCPRGDEGRGEFAIRLAPHRR